ncbi:MAG: repressor LexA [Cyanobacteria bacterium J083]|nr:MAG: repressor LexA [Cyanobacteria bacterium J083]
MESLTPAQQELYDWLNAYIQENHYAPSIRQMMEAMNLKSPAPIQSRLERLRRKGYIDWVEGKARTIRILKASTSKSIPVLGAIAAGGLVETFTDLEEQLDFSSLLNQSNQFALRVVGDSMIDDSIADGDFAIMRSLNPDEQAKEGDIVAARVEGHGTTLKHFYRLGNKVVLKAANSQYEPIEIEAENIQIQGILIGVWRNYAHKK